MDNTDWPIMIHDCIQRKEGGKGVLRVGWGEVVVGGWWLGIGCPWGEVVGWCGGCIEGKGVVGVIAS